MDAISLTNPGGGLTSTLQGMLGGGIWLIIICIVVVFLFIIGGIIAYIIWNKKRWNLRVEFKLVRSDGKFVGAEWGKGAYLRSGRVMLKRKGVAKYYMKPFKLSKFLQGSNILTVEQIGSADFIPVYPKSFTRVESENGKIYAIENIAGNVEDSRAWKNYNERELKSAFSIQSFLTMYGQYLAIGIMLLLVFIGFSILWARIPSICGTGA